MSFMVQKGNATRYLFSKTYSGQVLWRVTMKFLYVCGRVLQMFVGCTRPHAGGFSIQPKVLSLLLHAGLKHFVLRGLFSNCQHC